MSTTTPLSTTQTAAAARAGEAVGPTGLPRALMMRSIMIHAGVTLAVIVALVWAPLRFGLPVYVDTGEITVTGAGYVLWLATMMTTGVTLVVGAALGLSRRTRSIAPLLGCTAAGLVFAIVSLNVPIW